MYLHEYRALFESTLPQITYQNFPKEGVNFIDIFPYIQATSLKDMEFLHIHEPIVLIPEARAFLFAGAIGLNRCIPIRKAGKLPGKTNQISYKTEYSEGSFEFQTKHFFPFIKLSDIGTSPIPVAYFDDVLATGQSAKSVIDSINNFKIVIEDVPVSFRVTNAYFYIELTQLNGRSIIPTCVNSLYKI